MTHFLMTARFKILTTYWFLGGLILLLLNDFVLKGLYGNWLTGKLSDFAGLFIFPIFWTALFPKRKDFIFIFTAIAFVLWKSTLSNQLIEGWNSIALLPISRVVDYSDIVALGILPFAYQIKADLRQVPINPTIPIILCGFSFMATSYRTDVLINKTYDFNYPKDSIIARIIVIDSLNYGYGVQFADNNPDTVELNLPSQFCFNRFDAIISIQELEDNKTRLTLINAIHKCPESKQDREELVNEFERVVVRRIKTCYNK